MRLPVLLHIVLERRVYFSISNTEKTQINWNLMFGWDLPLTCFVKSIVLGKRVIFQKTFALKQKTAFSEAVF